MFNDFKKHTHHISSNISKINKETKTILIIILVNAILLSVIACFQFTLYDQKLYLHETVMMSELFKQGKWIGNYGVGVHGFLFKLPVALLFIITGPSTYIATMFHVFLSSITSWIFYLLIRDHTKIKRWSVLALILLISNYSYLNWSLTYHRETPVLFALVLFTYNIIKNNKKIFVNSILLLLILDAKEHVFFSLLPPLFICLFIINFSNIRSLTSSTIKTLKSIILLLLPSLGYLYLMFNTSLIPINMFNASILGLTNSHFSYQIQHTLQEKTLASMSIYTNISHMFNLGKITPLVIVLGYFEKLLCISNFSFQGIPLVVLVPSLASSIYLFKKWLHEKKPLVFINLFYWSSLFIYMIRSSHQRYIFYIIPFAIIFFIYFFKFILNRNKKFRPYFIGTLLITSITTTSTILYQDIGDPRKLFNILISILISGLLFALFYFKRYRLLIVKFIMVSVITASLFINTYSMLTKNQIYKNKIWGINGEADKIAELLEPEDIIFVDCQSGTNSEFTYLINIYRKNNYLPIEWHWKLDKKKINRKLDAIDIQPNFYYLINMEDMDNFNDEILQKHITKIILLKSDLENEKFPLEDYIDTFNKENWLELNTVEQLKNKKVYIFKVKDEKQ